MSKKFAVFAVAVLIVLIVAAGAGVMNAAAQPAGAYDFGGYPPPGATPPGYPPPGGGDGKNTPAPTWTPGPPDRPFDAGNLSYNDSNRPAAAGPARVALTEKMTAQAGRVVVSRSIFARLLDLLRGWLLYAK